MLCSSSCGAAAARGGDGHQHVPMQPGRDHGLGVHRKRLAMPDIPCLEPITQPGCPHGPPPAVPKGFAVPKRQNWDSLFLCEQKPVPLGGFARERRPWRGMSPRMDAQTQTGQFLGLVLSPRLLWRMPLPTGQREQDPWPRHPSSGEPSAHSPQGSTFKSNSLAREQILGDRSGSSSLCQELDPAAGSTDGGVK